MSIRQTARRLNEQRRLGKRERALTRAVMGAPTQATRQELLAVLGR